MPQLFTSITAAAAMALALFTQSTDLRAEDTASLRVHEWGTFTMVPNEAGIPLMWYAVPGPVELPAFVHGQTRPGMPALARKSTMAAVRMETPVLYFYADADVDLTVNVDFPGGTVTEWYPQGTYTITKDAADKDIRGPFRWAHVQLRPNAKLPLPLADGNSHYFAARGVNSTPVTVATADGKLEHEEFIFYRGIRYAGIESLHTAATREGVLIGPANAKSPTAAIVFQNNAGKMRWQQVPVTDSAVMVQPEQWPIADRIPDQELKQILLSTGLTGLEADAMLTTWKKDWFEPGLRVFYLLPRPLVDEILPLAITPPPTETVRAFVARVDLLTPVQLDAAATAVRTLPLEDAVKWMNTEFGRFAIAAHNAVRPRMSGEAEIKRHFVVGLRLMHPGLALAETALAVPQQQPETSAFGASLRSGSVRQLPDGQKGLRD